jgi:thiamine-phosphate pyrophosphorylase
MKVQLILDHATFGDGWLAVAKRCAPFCDSLRYRTKGLALTTAQIYNNAARLRDALPNSTLLLSDNADMAAMLGYDGVSLGANSLPIKAVRKAFPLLTLGYAAHTVAECRLAADYHTLSPIFDTPKPYEVKPLGLIPAPTSNVYAMGGINTSNINQLHELGYAGIAGIGFYKDIEAVSEAAHRLR